MPKYLLTASYTAAGSKALAGDSATGRKAAIARAAKSLGGKLESFYYALGETDVFLIIDLPDNGAAARLSLTIRQHRPRHDRHHAAAHRRGGRQGARPQGRVPPAGTEISAGAATLAIED